MPDDEKDLVAYRRRSSRGSKEKRRLSSARVQAISAIEYDSGLATRAFRRQEIPHRHAYRTDIAS